MHKNEKFSKNDEIKQIILIRTDLKMTKGKIAVQTAHAAVSAQELVRNRNPLLWKKWLQEGQKKIVLKVNSEAELVQYFVDAQKNNLPAYLIQDRGLTQLPPNTKTAIGIGPITENEAKLISLDKLKLL
ncbi:MAG: peptidyl-tRNA hydrolase Pth2 [Candidatus Helarchaeota archaeon]